MTKVLKSHEIDQAVALLKRGEAIAFPTETVYGIGALDPQKIFYIKERPFEKKITALISSIDQIEKMAHLPALFYTLAKRFFPGPLTIVLTSKEGGTIGVRMPLHPVALKLVEEVGGVLPTSSANLSGKRSALTLEEVLEDLEGRIAAVIEDGSSPIGLPSTVISLVDTPLLLREGALPLSEIEAATNCSFC